MWLEQGQDRDSDHGMMNFHRILISNIWNEYSVLNSLFIEKIHQSFEKKHNISSEFFANFDTDLVLWQFSPSWKSFTNMSPMSALKHLQNFL
jgi:hypothetical protein